MPVIMSSVLPRPKQDAAEFTHMLNLRTQEAATEVMKNWNGKTVVMAWEHRHIADEKLMLAFPRLKVTLRQLFNLDNIGNVPKTWPGDNYDYFWIIDYDGRPNNEFSDAEADVPAPYQNVPSNDWDPPAALPKDCEAAQNAIRTLRPRARLTAPHPLRRAQSFPGERDHRTSGSASLLTHRTEERRPPALHDALDRALAAGRRASARPRGHRPGNCAGTCRARRRSGDDRATTSRRP